MSETISPILFRGMHRGMADETVLADSLVPTTQFRLLHNLDNDIIGAPKRRLGLTRLGSAEVIVDNIILGLHNHISTTSANSQIVAFVNQASDATCESYYLSGATWTNKALAFTANLKVRTVTFLNYIMAVNGTDSPKSWTGAVADSWGTTNLTSAPTGSLIETYKQQVYIASSTNDTLYWSSIPTGGAITWTVATDNFQINPNDGTRITALKRYGSELLIHKSGAGRAFMYRYDGTSSDPDPIIQYGAVNQESVFVTAGVCWFFDSVAREILGYAGGYPEIISKPVKSFLRAIPTSNFPNLCMFGDDDHVELHIGDVTVGGTAFNNCSVRYTISTQTWTVRTYAKEFRVFTNYDDGTTPFNLGGSTVGDVVKMDTGNSDLGTGIGFTIETAWLVPSGNPSIEYRLAQFSAYINNSSSVYVTYKTDYDNTWRPLGSCKRFVNSWGGINVNFHRIKFRFSGFSDSDPLIFDGFSLLAPLLTGVEKESKEVQ